MTQIKSERLIKDTFNKPKINSGLFSSRSEEWETPQYVFDILNNEFRFQVDVCATSENSKCAIYFDKEINGLKQEWSPFRCWMNPPYGRSISRWIKKASDESTHGALVVCLIPSRTDTKWWHEWVMKSSEIWFVAGRLSFGNEKQSAPFPSCVVIYYPELDNPIKLAVPIIRSVKFEKRTPHLQFIGQKNPPLF